MNRLCDVAEQLKDKLNAAAAASAFSSAFTASRASLAEVEPRKDGGLQVFVIPHSEDRERIDMDTGRRFRETVYVYVGKHAGDAIEHDAVFGLTEEIADWIDKDGNWTMTVQGSDVVLDEIGYDEAFDEEQRRKKQFMNTTRCVFTLDKDL